jgi:hypothetical protein
VKTRGIRYKHGESFHWHCTKRHYDQFGQDERDARKSDNESGFKEGGKKPPASDTDTAPSSRGHIGEFGCQNEPATAGSQDVDMLMECRSVIVDLGNTCWTSSFQ